jgi:cytoskeletal protein CcmA (bactofilin family)
MSSDVAFLSTIPAVSAISTISKGFSIRGQLTCHEDLVLEGRVEGGPIWCERGAVTIAAGATVTGDIIARDITVFGSVSGTLLATEIVDIRAPACVTGRIVSATIILEDGASFNGRVEPRHVEAALSVARYRRAG